MHKKKTLDEILCNHTLVLSSISIDRIEIAPNIAQNPTGLWNIEKIGLSNQIISKWTASTAHSKNQTSMENSDLSPYFVGGDKSSASVVFKLLERGQLDSTNKTI